MTSCEKIESYRAVLQYLIVQVGTNTAELGTLGVPMLVVLPTYFLEVFFNLHYPTAFVIFTIFKFGTCTVETKISALKHETIYSMITSYVEKISCRDPTKIFVVLMFTFGYLCRLLEVQQEEYWACCQQFPGRLVQQWHTSLTFSFSTQQALSRGPTGNQFGSHIKLFQ